MLWVIRVPDVNGNPVALLVGEFPRNDLPIAGSVDTNWF
jgi:hypothetical protein